MSRLLTSKEAAQYLGVAEQTLRIFRMSGKGPRYVKIGGGPKGRVRYKLEDMDAYVAACTYKSTTEECVVRAEFADPCMDGR
mgnify:CR=1 FL=1